MPKKRSFFIFFLILTLLFTYTALFPAAAARSLQISSIDPDMPVSVGVLYGSSAVCGANAYSSTGFNIGYYDSGNNFVNVYTTAERFISAAKDRTLWVSGNVVSDIPNSGTKVGAYHIELIADYPDQQSAEKRLEEVKAAGLPSPFLAYVNGAFRIRIDEFSTAQYAQQSADSFSKKLGGAPVQIVGESANTISFLNMNENGKLLFEFDVNGKWPSAKPIQVQGQQALIKNGTTFYRGVFTYMRVNDNVTLINTVDMQDYLKGVVPSEMPVSWPLEALKAQAVCARTYAYNNIGRHASSGFDVCNSTHCQVYGGTKNEKESSNRAIDETKSVVLTYAGLLAEAYFHSSSGGYTESAQNVWGSTSYPYLTAVPSPYEDLEQATYGTWSAVVTLDELTQYFRQKGYDIDKLVSFYVENRTHPGGNVCKVTGVDVSGKTFSIEQCDKIRIALSKYVKSPNFEILNNSSLHVNNNTQKLVLGAGDIYAIGKDGVKKIQNISNLTVATKDGNLKLGSGDGSLVIRGRGWGHNVGMSQYGAKGMAENGFTYEQILSYYFPGTQLSNG